MVLQHGFTTDATRFSVEGGIPRLYNHDDRPQRPRPYPISIAAVDTGTNLRGACSLANMLIRYERSSLSMPGANSDSSRLLQFQNGVLGSSQRAKGGKAQAQLSAEGAEPRLLRPAVRSETCSIGV